MRPTRNEWIVFLVAVGVAILFVLMVVSARTL
jgi:hypothetical protein